MFVPVPVTVMSSDVLSYGCVSGGVMVGVLLLLLLLSVVVVVVVVE